MKPLTMDLMSSRPIAHTQSHEDIRESWEFSDRIHVTKRHLDEAERESSDRTRPVAAGLSSSLPGQVCTGGDVRDR